MSEQARRRREAKAVAERVLTYLNERAGTKYRPTEAHLRLMMGRILGDQANEVEMRAVVDTKVKEWGADPERRRFLSPDTLFNATKYAKYVGQLQIGAVVSTRKQSLIAVHLQEPGATASGRVLVCMPTMLEKVNAWEIVGQLAKNPGYRRAMQEHKGCVLVMRDGEKPELLGRFSPREIAEGLRKAAA